MNTTDVGSEQLIQDFRPVVSDIEAVMKAAARTTNTYVRENPWPSIGMAAGAALIVGLLINRRRETDHG